MKVARCQKLKKTNFEHESSFFKTLETQKFVFFLRFFNDLSNDFLMIHGLNSGNRAEHGAKKGYDFLRDHPQA